MEENSRWKNLLLAGAGLLIGFGILEAGLRIAHISFPEVYGLDLARGSRLRPGVEGDNNKEGHAHFKINSDGLRDREHSIFKPPGTIRIAVLGDSFAEAMQVDEDSSFPHVLERELSHCEQFAGKPVEVLNFGSSGYSTAQELLTLRDQVWKYSPDYVLLAFFTGNDVRDNDGKLMVEPLSPFFYYRGGQLLLDTSFAGAYRTGGASGFLRSVRGRIVDHSRVLQVFYEARRRLRARGSAAAPLEPGDEPGVDNRVFSPPRDPEFSEAWHITEGLLRMFRDEVQSRGAELLLVTLSCGIQVHPDPAVREAFQKRLGIDDLLYPDQRLRAFAQQENIRVLTLAPAFQEYAQRTHQYLHGFSNTRLGAGHWNETGHRLAGETIAAWICGGAK